MRDRACSARRYPDGIKARLSFKTICGKACRTGSRTVPIDREKKEEAINYATPAIAPPFYSN